jgi:hypothetical protein
MSELEPSWSPERHLDRVVRRGRQLRRRRAFIVSAPAGVLALVGVLALAGSAPLTSRRVQTAQQDVKHAPAASPVRGDDGGGGVPPTDVAPNGVEPQGDQPNGGGTSGAGRAAGTPGSGAPAQSVPATPVPVTGARPPNGAPSTGPPDAGGSADPGGQPPGSAAPTAPTATSACSASALDYSTVTDRSRYAPGQAVSISLVVRNHTNRPCDGPSPCGIGPWATVQNASGTVVWQSHPIAVACTNPPPGPPRLGPGQSVTYGAGTWNQEVCSASGTCSGQAPLGTYRAVAHRDGVTAAGARFSIR